MHSAQVVAAALAVGPQAACAKVAGGAPSPTFGRKEPAGAVRAFPVVSDAGHAARKVAFPFASRAETSVMNGVAASSRDRAIALQPGNFSEIQPAPGTTTASHSHQRGSPHENKRPTSPHGTHIAGNSSATKSTTRHLN